MVYSLWVCSEPLTQVKEFTDLWVLFGKEGQTDERKERMTWIQAVKTSFVCRWLCSPMELEVESLLLCSRRGQDKQHLQYEEQLYCKTKGFSLLPLSGTSWYISERARAQAGKIDVWGTLFSLLLLLKLEK